MSEINEMGPKSNIEYATAMIEIKNKRIAELEAQLEELRKQEPCGWVIPKFFEEGVGGICAVRWGTTSSGECLPVYAAPIPPEGSKT